MSFFSGPFLYELAQFLERCQPPGCIEVSCGPLQRLGKMQKCSDLCNWILKLKLWNKKGEGFSTTLMKSHEQCVTERV